MTVLEYIKKFFSLRSDEQILLVIASFMHLFAYSLLKYVPIRYCLFLLSSKQKNIQNSNKKELVVKTIFRIKKYFPIRSNCLLLSIITLNLAKIRGLNCQVKYSIRLNPSHEMLAHSYVVFDDGYTLFKNNNYVDVL